MYKLRRILGILLCLLLLPFGTAAAGEGNLLSGTWTETTGSRGAQESGGTITLPLANSAGIASAFVPVTKGAAYELSFTYSLSEEGRGSVKVCGFDKNNDETAIGPVVSITSLPAGTDTEYTITFMPSEIRDGIDVKYVKVNFASTITRDCTEVFTVRNITLLRVPGDEVISNGGAEIVWNGAAVGITGGTLIENTAEAQSGKNMMRIDAGEEMHMPLVLVETASPVKIHGFIKRAGLTEGSSVTATLRHDNKDGIVLAEKPVQFAGDGWELLRFSGMPYSTNVVLTIKVEGEGSVYADGFVIEKDENLVPDAIFADEASWTVAADSLKTDGNCPDGQNYVEGGSGILAAMQSPISVQTGEKYRISAWLKTAGTATARILLDTDESAIAAKYPGWERFIVEESTDGAWKHVEFVLTVPEGMESFALQFEASGTTDSDTASFNMPRVEKAKEKEIGFYIQEFEAEKADGSGVNVTAPRLEPYGYAFQNVLGAPVRSITEIAGNLTAVCITPEPDETSDSVLILAAYSTNNGQKELLHVTVGTPSSAPRWETGVTDAGGKSVTGVNYPSVTANADEIPAEADEIHAYLWNSVSGLRPAGEYGILLR